MNKAKLNTASIIHDVFVCLKHFDEAQSPRYIKITEAGSGEVT